jgi:hypothetical protein
LLDGVAGPAKLDLPVLGAAAVSSEKKHASNVNILIE